MEEAAALDLLSQINGDWNLVEVHHLERVWTFRDFLEALDFVNQAGAICETEGHHADFEFGWGRVKAIIWTHKINGLTESDFILAAKLDRI
ncbi:MAG: 4a-hydroxytetrahydrobiopterin dehydratase [Candidatus Poseidoniales archaeon]|nr:4a-hydroxytetrahydrobiopterin dehydratase [Candidatus Poseidoniales archaeon]